MIVYLFRIHEKRRQQDGKRITVRRIRSNGRNGKR